MSSISCAATAISPRSSPADYFLIADTFHGVPDKEALARGVARALKPGDDRP
jgi:hypothetical protein